jgi:predicted PurR-regulated permease PerM
MRSESLSWAVRGAGFAVGVGLVLALAWLAIAARDVLFLVFLAILLGAGLEPVISWLRSRLPLGRGPAILVVYAAFLALVGVMALLVVPAALVQIELALNRLPTFLETIRGWSSALRPTALADGIDAVIDSAERALRPAPPDAGAVVDVSLVVAAGGGAVVTLLTLVFFWLTERSRLQRYALAFLPEHRRAGIRDAWNAIETRLGLWVRGQLVLMAALGAATAVAYSLLGLPAALLLALIAALAEIVPMVGPLIGALPALLVATTVSNETAVLTLVVYVVIQFLEANVLVPIVMRNAIGLSPFLVAVSLLAGYTVGGPLGAIVAVPAMAAVEAVLERLQARDVPVQIDVSNEAPDDAEREAQEEHPPAAPAPKPRRRTASRAASRG